MDPRSFLDSYQVTDIEKDPLPIKVLRNSIIREEIPGQAIHWGFDYLDQRSCPLTLINHILEKLYQEVHQTDFSHCAEATDDSLDGSVCGDHEVRYEPLKLMRAIVKKLDEICVKEREDFHDSVDGMVESPDMLPHVFAVSYNNIKNSRRFMEDRMAVLPRMDRLFNLPSPVSYFAVFDGHNGAEAAAYCAAQLHQYLIQSMNQHQDVIPSISDAFESIDEAFIQKCRSGKVKSGSTVVLSLIMPEKLYVAWLGDSQAVLARNNEINNLVTPHKPERKDELDRIRSMGGDVIQMHDTYRVNGNLAVSRAVGDADDKKFIIATPDIKMLELDGSEEFLILACDGLWDEISPEGAAQIVRRQVVSDPTKVSAVSQKLVQKAKQQGSQDNISVIVVFLEPLESIKNRYEGVLEPESEAEVAIFKQSPEPVDAIPMEKFIAQGVDGRIPILPEMNGHVTEGSLLVDFVPFDGSKESGAQMIGDEAGNQSFDDDIGKKEVEDLSDAEADDEWQFEKPSNQPAVDQTVMFWDQQQQQPIVDAIEKFEQEPLVDNLIETGSNNPFVIPANEAEPNVIDFGTATISVDTETEKVPLDQNEEGIVMRQDIFDVSQSSVPDESEPAPLFEENVPKSMDLPITPIEQEVEDIIPITSEMNGHVNEGSLLVDFGSFGGPKESDTQIIGDVTGNQLCDDDIVKKEVEDVSDAEADDEWKFEPSNQPAVDQTVIFWDQQQEQPTVDAVEVEQKPLVDNLIETGSTLPSGNLVEPNVIDYGIAPTSVDAETEKVPLDQIEEGIVVKQEIFDVNQSSVPDESVPAPLFDESVPQSMDLPMQPIAQEVEGTNPFLSEMNGHAKEGSLRVNFVPFGVIGKVEELSDAEADDEWQFEKPSNQTVNVDQTNMLNQQEKFEQESFFGDVNLAEPNVIANETAATLVDVNAGEIAAPAADVNAGEIAAPAADVNAGEIAATAVDVNAGEIVAASADANANEIIASTDADVAKVPLHQNEEAIVEKQEIFDVSQSSIPDEPAPVCEESLPKPVDLPIPPKAKTETSSKPKADKPNVKSAKSPTKPEALVSKGRAPINSSAASRQSPTKTDPPSKTTGLVNGKSAGTVPRSAPKIPTGTAPKPATARAAPATTTKAAGASRIGATAARTAPSKGINGVDSKAAATAKPATTSTMRTRPTTAPAPKPAAAKAPLPTTTSPKRAAPVGATTITRAPTARPATAAAASKVGGDVAPRPATALTRPRPKPATTTTSATAKVGVAGVDVKKPAVPKPSTLSAKPSATSTRPPITRTAPTSTRTVPPSKPLSTASRPAPARTAPRAPIDSSKVTGPTSTRLAARTTAAPTSKAPTTAKKVESSVLKPKKPAPTALGKADATAKSIKSTTNKKVAAASGEKAELIQQNGLSSSEGVKELNAINGGMNGDLNGMNGETEKQDAIKENGVHLDDPVEEANPAPPISAPAMENLLG